MKQIAIILMIVIISIVSTVLICHAKNINRQITCNEIFDNNINNKQYDLILNIAGEIYHFDPFIYIATSKYNLNPIERWLDFRITLKSLFKRFKKKYPIECNFCDDSVDLKFKYHYTITNDGYYGTLITFKNNYLTIEIINSIYIKKIKNSKELKYFKTYICFIEGYTEFEIPEELTKQQYYQIVDSINYAKLYNNVIKKEKKNN